MDGQRFDDLSRAMVATGSRRFLVGGVVGLLASLVVGGRSGPIYLVSASRQPGLQRTLKRAGSGEQMTAERLTSQCLDPKAINPVTGDELGTDGWCSKPDWLVGGVTNGPDGLFANSCYNHDICYSTCGTNWQQCNSQFLKDMQGACNQAYGKSAVTAEDKRKKKNKNKNKNKITKKQNAAKLAACLAEAIIYHDGVNIGVMLGYFDSTQDRFCCHELGETCTSVAQCNPKAIESLQCTETFSIDGLGNLLACATGKTCCLRQNWGPCGDDCDCCGTLRCRPGIDGQGNPGRFCFP